MWITSIRKCSLGKQLKQSFLRTTYWCVSAGSNVLNRGLVWRLWSFLHLLLVALDTVCSSTNLGIFGYFKFWMVSHLLAVCPSHHPLRVRGFWCLVFSQFCRSQYKKSLMVQLPLLLWLWVHFRPAALDQWMLWNAHLSFLIFFSLLRMFHHESCMKSILLADNPCSFDFVPVFHK